jgi:hypothetical protein
MNPPKWNGRRTIVVLAALAFAAKVVLALYTFGCFDALIWQRDLEALRAHGVPALYRGGATYYSVEDRLLISQPFIHPPFMIHVLHFWDSLSKLTRLPMQFWMRLCCAVADVASLLLLAGILRRARGDKILERLGLVAISPTSILISGFHGNTDPIMMAFVVAAIYSLERFRTPWVAGAALGVALNVKLAALIFVPAIGLSVPGIRRKFEFTGAAAVTFLVGSVPYLFQEPGLILSRMGGYRSFFGWWGLGRLCVTLAHDGGLRAACAEYSTYGRYLVMLLIAATAIGVAWRRKSLPLLLQCGLAAFTFFAITPGFGVQYLAWLVPFTALLPRGRAVIYHLVSGAFLFAYYNRGAQGLPWYFANEVEHPVWYGHVVFLGLLCWLVICAYLVFLARQASNQGAGVGSPTEDSPSRP